MALPSLALGIGLQGKPIDRAALNLRRQEGAEKAKVRAAEALRKKREPYRKMMMELGSKAYFPFQKEIIANKSADFYNMLENSEGEPNFGEISSTFSEIANLGASYQNDYKKYSGAAANPKYNHLNSAFNALNNLPDLEAVNKYFSQNAGVEGEISEGGQINMGIYEQSPTETFVNKYINLQGDNILEPITQAQIDDVGGAEYVTRVPRSGASEDAYKFAINDKSTFFTEANKLQNQLLDAGTMPDLSTEKGNLEFQELVKGTIKEKVTQAFRFTDSKKNSSGQTININTGVTDEGGTMQPFEVKNMVQYGSKSYPVTSFYTNNLGDNIATIPISENTKYANGKAMKSGGTAVYNQVGVSLVIAKPFTYTANGGSIEIPSGYVVPDGYEEQLIKAGAIVEPRVLAWGLTKNNKWFYSDKTGVVQSIFMKESAEDKQIITVVNNGLEVEKERLKAFREDYYGRPVKDKKEGKTKSGQDTADSAEDKKEGKPDPLNNPKLKGVSKR